jgi:hypothetical protein
MNLAGQIQEVLQKRLKMKRKAKSQVNEIKSFLFGICWMTLKMVTLLFSD